MSRGWRSFFLVIITSPVLPSYGEESMSGWLFNSIYIFWLRAPSGSPGWEPLLYDGMWLTLAVRVLVSSASSPSLSSEPSSRTSPYWSSSPSCSWTKCTFNVTSRAKKHNLTTNNQHVEAHLLIWLELHIDSIGFINVVICKKRKMKCDQAWTSWGEFGLRLD